MRQQSSKFIRQPKTKLIPRQIVCHICKEGFGTLVKKEPKKTSNLYLHKNCSYSREVFFSKRLSQQLAEVAVAAGLSKKQIRKRIAEFKK